MCKRQLRFQERQSSDENDKGFLVDRPMTPKPDDYVGLDLTLIECIETSTVCTSEVMRRIGDDTNALGMMQVTKLLGLRLRLR